MNLKIIFKLSALIQSYQLINQLYIENQNQSIIKEHHYNYQLYQTNHLTTHMTDHNQIGSFNYNFITALKYFENAVAEARHLNFLHNKLTQKVNYSTQKQVKDVGALAFGANNQIFINFYIIHLLHLEQCTFMLATNSKPYNKNTLSILVAVNPPANENVVQIWQECLTPQISIRVSNPFRRQVKNEFIPYLIFSTESINIISQTTIDKNISQSKCNSENLRQRANNFFKNKKYVQAIMLYEQSLMHISDFNSKNRSILFSNTAACLYQLKLFKSCSIYADLAIMADVGYNKGYFRKINSLLQSRLYSEIVPLMAKINTLISKSDFDALNIKYTHYVSNDTGIFNWVSIIGGTNNPQGQYVSDKIEKVRTEHEIKYYAKEAIDQYEIILINKPLIYIKETGSKFKESFINFLKQVQNYYLYDQDFEEAIHYLPCKCHPTHKEREQYYQYYKGRARSLPKKELFNKMQRCIFEEKSLDKCEEQNGYGIWKQMFYFEDKCIPNCTGVHINGNWMVNTLRPIEKGSPLSLDLIADVQPGKRKETLKIKFDIECGCQICEYRERRQQCFTTIEEFYEEIEHLQSPKIKKQYIWNIINNEWQDREVLFTGEFSNLIYYYIYYIEKQCEWDDVLNLLRLKEENDNEDINQSIDEVIKRLLMKYLSIGEKDIDKLYDLIIAKYIKKYHSSITQ